MTNKQKQAHVARRITVGDKRVRTVMVKNMLTNPKFNLQAFLNLFRCKEGACRKLNK